MAMIIDQTRYDAFWRNPEKFRLTYEVNLVPRVLSYGLARGIALHEIADMKRKGRSDAEIQQELDSRPDISKKAIAVAWSMWEAFERKFAGRAITTLETELEFAYPIPGSPHTMAGRIDELLEVGGFKWCGELKTANAKAQYERTKEDWETKPQADFEIIGARSLGHDVAGVYVRTIIEKTPPECWEPIEVKRSEHRLNAMQLHVHQTCETIEMYRRTFGIDMPWPHIGLSYPCSKGATCEYAGICQQTLSKLDPALLADFKPREEHLGIIARAKAAEAA